MAELERTYTIPLRKEWLKAPRYRRAKRTVAAVREFLTRHMKPTELKLGRYLNLEIWKHGMRNPPPRIRVTAKKDDKGVVTAELLGAPVEKPSEKKEEKKVEVKKPEEKPAVAPAPAPAIEKKPAEEKKAETKPAAAKPAKPRAKKTE